MRVGRDLAIIVLLFIKALSGHESLWSDLLLVVVGFPLILLVVYLLYRFILLPLLTYFSRIKEYMFLVSIAWCLCIAELSLLVPRRA